MVHGLTLVRGTVHNFQHGVHLQWNTLKNLWLRNAHGARLVWSCANYALKTDYYAFEQCSKTKPIMFKSMLTKQVKSI